MKRLLIIAVAICSVVAFTAGCAYKTGNVVLQDASEESLGSKLVKGKTTKAEVKRNIGEPNNTSFTDGGLEIWNYNAQRSVQKFFNYIPIVSAACSGSDDETKKLSILFDEDGVVKNYTYLNSKGETMRGLCG